MKNSYSCHDRLLDIAQKQKWSVSILTKSKKMIKGKIKSYDQFVIYLENSTSKILLFKKELISVELGKKKLYMSKDL